MPKKIVSQAENLLKDLENNSAGKNKVSKNSKAKAEEEMQLSFFQLDDPVLSEIKSQIEDLDINSLTPVDALLKLNEIKKMVGG